MATPAYRSALVIGRFQPPHNGHLHLLREAGRLAERVIAVVGSADKSHTRDNPFTAGERIAMLDATAQTEGLPIAHTIPVDDLGQYHLWVAHVAAHVPPFDVVVTGSPLTAELFRAAGHQVHMVEKVDRQRFRATAIRERLMRGEEVADVVPAAVAAALGEDRVKERLRAIGG